MHAYFGDKGGARKLKALLSEGKSNNLKTKTKALKKRIEKIGPNFQVTHQGNSHLYEPTKEQQERNRKAYEEKKKRFPNLY